MFCTSLGWVSPGIAALSLPWSSHEGDSLLRHLCFKILASNTETQWQYCCETAVHQCEASHHGFCTIESLRLCVSIPVYFLQWVWMQWWRWLTHLQPIVWTSEILKLLRSWGKKQFVIRQILSLWPQFPRVLQWWVVFLSRGTIDDCELVEGLVLTQKVANTGVTRVEKAKIGLIQFCLSAPKTDVSQTVARANPHPLGLGTNKQNNRCFF